MKARPRPRLLVLGLAAVGLASQAEGDDWRF